uniref:Uncharacterized protein n=1 Tax=viral metagenome TaxID=1070528 RepID=A0A6C0BMH9_9ZZZZ
MESEEEIFERLARRRQQCLKYVHSQASRLSDAELETRLAEIREWETQVVDMWTRLEMDARKGDVSTPLKSTRTPAQNWFTEKVAPFFFLAQFLGAGEPTENKT